jgi:hypothetical protein
MATIVPLPFKLITVSIEIDFDDAFKPTGSNNYRVEMKAVDEYLDEKGLRDKVFLTVTEDKSFGLRFENASDAAMFKLTML